MMRYDQVYDMRTRCDSIPSAYCQGGCGLPLCSISLPDPRKEEEELENALRLTAFDFLPCNLAAAAAMPTNPTQVPATSAWDDDMVAP
eukprot:1674399-Amphidinium_carterae.1